MKRWIVAVLFACIAMPAWADVKIQEITSPGGIKAWLVQ